jgi:hypothetical protein
MPDEQGEQPDPPRYFRCECGAVLGRVEHGEVVYNEGDRVVHARWVRLPCSCGKTTEFYPAMKFIRAYLLTREARHIWIEHRARGLK